VELDKCEKDYLKYNTSRDLLTCGCGQCRRRSLLTVEQLIETGESSLVLADYRRERDAAREA
jgi:hypothetical protein